MSRFRPLFLLLLPLAALVWASCTGGDDDAPPDLTLFFTGTVNGYIEPCGCVAGQIGGIDRIAGFIEDGMRDNPNALFVDVGDLVGEEVDVSEQVRKQLPLKADAFFSVWSQLGCEALGLGENDILLLGRKVLTELADKHDLPVLCGNLIDAKTRERIFPSYTIVERGGKRIGIFSLLGPKLGEPKAQDREIVDVAKRLQKFGLELEPWRARARAIVDELLPQTDLILCASHVGYDFNRWLANELPQIDLVFGGHFGSSEQASYIVGRDPQKKRYGTPVLISLVRGSRVDRVDWWWPDEDEFFVPKAQRAESGNGRLKDSSLYAGVEMEFDVGWHEHESMKKRELLYPPDEYEDLLNDKIYSLNQAERNYLSAGVPPDVNRFSHVQVPMHRELRRSEMALSAVDEYHAALGELWPTEPAPEGRRSAVYADPKNCIECHPRQYDFWLATRHSYALTALEATGQEVDAECFYCHTVGFRLPGGFKRPGKHAGFENVQCAACHGPGAGHMSGGASYLDPGYFNPSATSACTECHTKEHDPKFPTKSMEKLSLVACPPLEPVEDRTATMLAVTAIAARQLEESNRPRWGDAVTAYQKAGLVDEAVRVAENWVARLPGRAEPRIRLGSLLQGGGRYEEAVQHFAVAVEKEPLDARGWMGLSRALMTSNPDRAMEAAREAYSLDVTDPRSIRLMAEIMLAQNRRASAEEIVAGYLQQFPQLARYFADLFAEAE